MDTFASFLLMTAQDNSQYNLFYFHFSSHICSLSKDNPKAIWLQSCILFPDCSPCQKQTNKKKNIFAIRVKLKGQRDETKGQKSW